MFTLYVIPGCPFCAKVLEFVKEHNIECEIKPTDQEENKQELLERGGKTQAPYLFDSKKGEGLYESDDIIEYLKTNNQ